MKAVLPDYAKEISPGKVEVQASEFYPFWLDSLGVSEPDQYWLDVAFVCMRMDIQLATELTESAPPRGGALVIIVQDSEKTYAMNKWPVGDGAGKLTRKKAQQYFQKVRRATPMGFDLEL